MRPIAVLVAAVLIAACGGDDDAAAPAATGDALVTGANVAAPATVPSTPVTVPDEFPPDVPIPTGVVLDNAEAHVGSSSTIFEVTGWYDGDPIRVARDYEAALTELGYEITSRTESPDNLYFVAENEAWYVSAGFFPDPIRNVGASVGITVAPAAQSAATSG